MAMERQKYHAVGGKRTHENCKAQTGVMRPGKTARDKARGVNRTHPNRRILDKDTGLYVKA